MCCDLWEGFIEAVQQEIPETQIVADRFHVSRHYREAADDVRKSELHRLKKEIPTEQYKKLKGSLWAFRKSAKDLTPEEKSVLNLFFRLAPSAKKSIPVTGTSHGNFRNAHYESTSPKENPRMD
mgnify:CR=1 FL=1